jgi:hypothetical protein
MNPVGRGLVNGHLANWPIFSTLPASPLTPAHVLLPSISRPWEMNNDVTTNSPASTETSDSDGDAVNCSTARVYFGPVQSPEKRLMASGVARSLSPVPDLPSPQGITDAPDEGNERSDEDGDETSDVAAHLSREDTPENDTLNQNGELRSSGFCN